MADRPRRAAGLVAALATMTMVLTSCTSAATGTSSSPSRDGSPGSGATSTGPAPQTPNTPPTSTESAIGGTTPTVIGTSSTADTTGAGSQTGSVGTETVTGTVRTITKTAGPTTPGPPPTTHEPAPTEGDCPYLSNEQVKAANGQHTGRTTVIATKPHPICIFTRSDGGYLATTRIVTAKTPGAAAAAVDQHVPVDRSNPATKPQGWTGGSMGNLHGVPGYPDAESIYAVSKGTTAIIAISNQAQSIKGRQMVTDIVQNLGL